MANQEIIFYDLPNKGTNKAWSLNTWKTRFALNYKGIPYKTEWIEYPDIKPTFQDHVPKADQYTVPTIILPDGTWVTDSAKIAEVLESRYPEKKLFLDSQYVPKVASVFPEIFGAAGVNYLPLIFKRIISPGSEAHFRTTREAAVGMTLEEFSKLGGEGVWKKAAPGLEKVTALLKENPEGPFFEGSNVTYADFIWAGFLIMTQRIGEDILGEFLKHTGDGDVHLKLLEAVKPWAERDDH
ncbi:putative glutathione S-transferase [Hypoxylon trugodes]|uniref:putative glutathione S-transferase n=1 Tax=Hypoxylon trugodes TaxID=326681 RepID=UPI002195511A|nr:putative glutathione S-transferase [Hypoxylon trugodes]KAI1384198.1 putative glutathione S-transferase [Hypoxylon trugodes]